MVGQNQRSKRLLNAQSRLYEARLLQLRNQIESLQAELGASVHYIERLQARAAAHERRIAASEEAQSAQKVQAHAQGIQIHAQEAQLRAQEAQLQWARHAIQGIFAGRLWRSMEFVGRVRKKLFPFTPKNLKS